MRDRPDLAGQLHAIRSWLLRRRDRQARAYREPVPNLVPRQELFAGHLGAVVRKYRLGIYNIFTHRHARIQCVRDIASNVGMIIDENVSVHDRCRHIEIMNPAAYKARLILLKNTLSEYGPCTAVL